MSGPEYWHGGGPIKGAWVLPPEETGRRRSGDRGVHVTTDRGLAATYASTADGTAWIYRVEPEGELEPVPSNVPGAPTVSFRCARARILARYTVSRAERARRRQAVARVAREAFFR